MTSYNGALRGDGLRIAIVCARFNDFITERLLAGARDGLVRHGVDDASITEAWCPGAFEIPLVAKRLAASGEYDAVVCLGAVIRGATAHFDYVAGQSAAGVARASLETGFGLAWTVVWLLVGLGLFAALGRGNAFAALLRWLPPIMLGVGLAWYFLLPGPAIGFALFVIGALCFGWQHRRG